MRGRLCHNHIKKDKKKGTCKMGVPQVIIIVLYAITLLLSAYEHGKPYEHNKNFWYSLIGVAIVFGLLIWGGFFW